MPRRARLASNAAAELEELHPVHPPPARPTPFTRRRSGLINLRAQQQPPPSTQPPQPRSPRSPSKRHHASRRPHTSPPSLPRRTSKTPPSSSPRAFMQVRVADFVTSSPARHSPAENALGPIDVTVRPPCYNLSPPAPTAAPSRPTTQQQGYQQQYHHHEPQPSPRPVTEPPLSTNASYSYTQDSIRSPGSSLASSVEPASSIIPSSFLPANPQPSSRHQPQQELFHQTQLQNLHQTQSPNQLRSEPQPYPEFELHPCLESPTPLRPEPPSLDRATAPQDHDIASASDSGVFMIRDTSHIDRLVNIVTKKEEETKDDGLAKEEDSDPRLRRPIPRPVSSSLGSEARNAEPIDLSDAVTEASTLLSSLSLSLSTLQGSSQRDMSRTPSGAKPPKPGSPPPRIGALPPLPPRGRRLVGERDLAACDRSAGSLSDWISDPSLFVRVTSAQTLESLASAHSAAQQQHQRKQSVSRKSQNVAQAFVRRGGVPPFWQRAAPRPVKYTFKPVRTHPCDNPLSGSSYLDEESRAPNSTGQIRNKSTGNRGLLKAYPQRVAALTYDSNQPPAPPKLPVAPHETGYAGLLEGSNAGAAKQRVVEVEVGQDDEESFGSVQRGVESIDPRFVLDMAGGPGSVGVTAARMLRRRVIGGGASSNSGSASGSQKRPSDESAVSSNATEYYEDDYTKFIEKKTASPLRLLASPPFPRILSSESRVVKSAALSRMELCRTNSTISLSTSDEDYAPTPLSRNLRALS